MVIDIYNPQVAWIYYRYVKKM